ncbi:MBL fold metallo-hydrolase [Sinorhizobium mexicanum]|uniref:MBL fold metallo-hydrolase n=1 Tax=Sinorhizobium mexicanum TaxID=375549 RepID=A0A859QIM0_9HYPH|nr:MBL fold metallo-hydrolase [Sinorhizobium mexicanum]MBP1883175.1 glyoxylase-like metal-dependent hydrolase (beta-lactamase superfamily II) [Sinorhizobium mexicanum]QLL60697.1 MBL fold metallo-hydrolase [Sinorhizobium mexicanum]
MAFSLTRRTLFGTGAAGALAAPALLTGFASAQDATEPHGMTNGTTFKTLKLGTAKITVISDGTRMMGKPHEIYGLNQPADAVSKLLTDNFLPADGFVNGFSPAVVDTGTDVVLFDTGFGEAGREMGTGRLVDGLKAAGYTPDQVSVVVITHMHGDHIGGLMTGGKPTFSNARYITGQVEYDFWKDEARVGTPAENGHKTVLEKVVPLAEKTTFIGDGADVVPGITALAAFGHSPGHMVFRLDSDNKALMLTADTANHYVLSLQRPDWEVRFDMDKAQAIAARRRVFDMIATDRLPFIGYHMPFPAVGFVERNDLGYRFVPATYQFDI